MRIRVAVVIILFALGPRLAYNQQPQPHKDGTSSNNAHEAIQQPPPGPLPTPNKPETPKQPQNPTNDPIAWWHKSEWVIVVITGVYTLISLGTLLAIRRQTDLAKEQIALIKSGGEATNKSATAAEKSAEAAQVNAKALITAERPLLLVSPGKRGYPPSELPFEAENFGKSPAEILFTQFDHLILPISDEPEFKNPPWINDRLLAHRDWLIPGADPYEIGTIHFSTLRTAVPEVVNEVNAGQKGIWLFGQIRYRGPLRNEVYESRFCYLWTPNGGFVMGGPAGYNDCT